MRRPGLSKLGSARWKDSVVVSSNKCFYCRQRMARRCAACPAIEARMLVMNYRAADLPPRRLLDFAVELTNNGTGRGGTTQGARDAGFSERDIWDIGVVGSSALTNHMAAAVGMRPNGKPVPRGDRAARGGGSEG